jgi:hypothetical protein
LVRRWVAEDRPIRVTASQQIEELVRAKHGQQMRRLRALYLDMIGSLSDTEVRGRLMAMDLSALKLDDQLRRASLTPPGDPVPPRFLDAACSLLAAALCTVAAMV